MSPAIRAYENKNITVDVLPNGKVIMNFWESESPVSKSLGSFEMNKLDAQEMSLEILGSILEWEAEINEKKNKLVQEDE